MKAGGISIHTVDVARGVMAEACGRIYALEPTRRLIAERALGANGVLNHPSAQGEGVTAGAYEVVLHVGAWLKAADYQSEQTDFLDIVPFRFTITKVEEHYHLPFKFTPWGFALFRGF